MSSYLNATVKFPSREVNTRYGKRINLVLVTDSGEEIKQWGEPTDIALTTLKKDQKVILMRDNDKYKIVPTSTYKKPAVVEPQPIVPDVDPTLCDEVKKHIQFYNFCLSEVQKQITALKDEESIRTIATSVFIQTMRSCNV